MQDRYLFRGKRIDDNGCDGEWVIGYHCYIGWTNEEKHYIIPHYSSAFYGLEIDPATVGQCTGLKDKNGRLVFEGDILDEDGYHFIVVYDQTWAKFKLKHDNKAYQYPEWNRGVRMEIIGNIHDKSEVE